MVFKMSYDKMKSMKMFKWNVCGWCIHFVCFLILLALTKDGVKAQELREPASDFSHHRIVQPIVHHGRTKREISSTKDESGAHHPVVTVTVPVDGEEYVLELRLNDELVTDNHVVSYQKGHKTVERKPNVEELDICQYTGSVRGKPGSWVAVSTCHGVRGVIYDGETLRYIEPAQGGGIQNRHYLYDHRHLATEFTCGYRGGVTNNTEFDPMLLKEHLKEKEIKKSRVSRHKRSSSHEDTQVRGPFNANKLSRYVELVLVADHREFLANREDMAVVHHQMKDVANIINAMYTPLNIFIALVGVVVWSERDEIDLEEDGDKTLTNFLQYRKQLSLRMPNDNAQLLTRQKFNDGVVGKGLKGPMCTYEFSGAVSTNHSTVIGLVAATIAHEMGHNFGMEHDTVEDCECPDDKCIMSPSSTAVVPVHWSSCSLKSLAVAFEKGMDYCLRNKPKRLYASPTCGNGFVEAGEQCDCGVPLAAGGGAGGGGDTARARCEACCHARTCTLRDNATCATGQCCDLTTCRPRPAGTVCRAAERECDLPEYCAGHSEHCPPDVHRADGAECARGGGGGGGAAGAYCAGGACRSHTDQCRLLWGTTGQDSSDRCYAQNTKGDINGNCGYSRTRSVFAACSAEDARCGLLQCRHLNERLEFGMESVSTLSQMFINSQGSIIPCRTAIIDLGLNDVDPGLVPDGAKCGDDKMCMNQKCVPVESVRQQLSLKESSVCPSNCSGRGVCNSEGHCHCDVGFAPPLCELPGAGGSVDSGPASDPSVQRNFMVTMYIIFLGIIPAVLLVMFLGYYSRHNVLGWWARPNKQSQSPKKASLQSRISRSASKFASNFQGNSQNNPQPVVQTLSNPDDMSSSLLRSDSDRSPAGNLGPSVNFFGNFKGFSLTPVDKNATVDKKDKQEPINETSIVTTKVETVVNKSAKITPVHRSGSTNQTLVNQGVLKNVSRSAPPLPVVPTLAKTSPSTSPAVKRSNSSVQNRIKSFISADKTDDVPHVVTNPPPRPVISSPILEASTCTAKELISPLQGSKTLGPIRAAPTIPFSSPDLPKRPLSMHSASGVPNKPLPEEPKKVKEGISLNRITSFLKQEKPKEKQRNPVERSHSLPKNPIHQVKVPKAADKVALRNLQISGPILQKDIELSVNTVPVVSDSEEVDDNKAFVNRAQSMRAPASQKPALQTFGSMRKVPGAPRPLSVAGRPTAPPPPLPATNEKSNEPPLYQNPKPKNEIKSTDYVDCIEEESAPLANIDESNGENIYTIIEESPVKHSVGIPVVPPPIKTIPQSPPEGYNTPKPITSGSTESMGLLGEIVDEIQNRNFDSIYSASTLSRKKKGREKSNENDNRDSTYMNSDYKAPESIYSNSGAKSSAASTTSSGYLHPSAVNVPTYLNKQDNNPEPNNEVAPSSPILKGNSKIPTFTRQITPPGLRTSTFKSVPQSPKNLNKNSNNITPKNIPNSPDVVSSCAAADIKKAKAPDVINNNNKLPNEAPKIANKPNVLSKPIDNRPPLRPAPTVEKKPTLKTTPTLKPINSSSNLVNKTQIEKTPNLNRINAKTEANVKAIADNLNKNKPKFPPKPASVVHRTDSSIKPGNTKPAPKASNIASLQQKFENRKSFGIDSVTVKK